jgi:hypothetical protein
MALVVIVLLASWSGLVGAAVSDFCRKAITLSGMDDIIKNKGGHHQGWLRPLQKKDFKKKKKKLQHRVFPCGPPP